MKSILWLGCTIANEFEDEMLKTYRNPFMIAQSNFEKAFLSELNEQFINLKIYTIPSMPYYLLNKKIFQKSKKIKLKSNLFTTTYPILNIKILKYIFIFFHSIYITVKYILSHNKDEKTIFIAANFLPVSVPVLIIGKLLKTSVTCLFCDLVEDLYGDNINLFRKYYKKFTYFISKNFDYYVLVSSYMNSKLNPKNRPYCIVEGVFNNDLEYQKKKRKKIFVYSGSLIKKYGIETAILAFKEAKLPSYELHIYGDGEYKKEMLNLIKEDTNIKYMGLVKRKDLFNALLEAQFLLNLRNPNDHFTYYSFPSKLFEYLASGACVISTRLRGIPEEYFDYFFTIDNMNIEKIAEKFNELAKYSAECLYSFGVKGREFIVNEKNAKKQVKKYIELIF